jgi:hypothetical protein
LLLLVVHRRTADLVAFRIGPAGSNRPAFAVSGNDDATANGGLAAFLAVETKRMVVDLRNRPGVGAGIADYRVVFAVVFACLLVVRRLPIAADAINGNFDVLSYSLVDTVVFFGAPFASFDLASFSFHVPRFRSWAKQTAAPTRQIASVNTIVLAFMFPPD